MTDRATTETPDRRESRSRGGLLFPLILIAIGVAFLLANLGYLPPISVRAILGLWPLILVVIGIELLFARREPFVALGLQLATIAVGVALIAAQPTALFGLTGTTSTQETVARNGATSLDLRIDAAAGDFTVTGGAAALVEARASGTEFRIRTERRDARAEVRVEEQHDHFRWGGDGPTLDVKVADDVPTKVSLDAGAGDIRLDLRSTRVTEVNIDAGAGDIHVIAPIPQGDVPISIEAGAAEIVIELPPGVEARVSVSGGAVSLNSSDPRLGVADRTGQTAGYASASARLTITVTAGAASVTVR